MVKASDAFVVVFDSLEFSSSTAAADLWLELLLLLLPGGVPCCWFALLCAAAAAME